MTVLVCFFVLRLVAQFQVIFINRIYLMCSVAQIILIMHLSIMKRPAHGGIFTTTTISPADVVQMIKINILVEV